MSDRADIPYLLVNVPLTDPTTPYHSIPYLVGAAVAAGFDGYRCVDANLDMLTHAACESRVARLLDKAAQIRGRLEVKEHLTRGEQIRYRATLKGIGLRPGAVEAAIRWLRDPTTFYDYRSYRQAAFVLRRWLALLGIDGQVCQFDDFAVNRDGCATLSNVDDLTSPRFLEGIIQPFRDYFDGPFDRLLAARPWRLVGLSVNYTSQLPFALWMAWRIRDRLPGALLCAGGTEISDLVKYVREPADIWRLFPGLDCLVVGEGETAITTLLETVAAGDDRAGLSGPGILRQGGESSRGLARYEDVGRLPSPRYDVWDNTGYWAPEPVLLYSPTRGCYWNRCTFCDYGLNTDRPTSPSRERPVETVIGDLLAMRRHARFVYFAVDAMSPSYLRRLCLAIGQAGLDIRWSAELRLERSFPDRGFGRLLAGAGCIAISFGYESGSQRILDLIDKGVRIAHVPAVLEELSNAGIGVQMMGFTGFPSETPEEARSTYRLLEENSSLWALAGIGEFQLTPGAIVAKQAVKFGIAPPTPRENDDIVRTLDWESPADAARDLVEPDPELAVVSQRVNRRIPFGRPFIGGIDSAHSLLYFDRFGTTLLPKGGGAIGASLVDTELHATPFANIDSFVTQTDLVEFHRRCREQGFSARTSDVMRWLDQPAETVRTPAGSRVTVEVFPGGGVLLADDAPADDETAVLRKFKELMLGWHGAA